MSEGIEGQVSVKSSKTNTVVSISIEGKTDPECAAWLMLEIQKLAKRCGLTIKISKPQKKAKKTAKKK
jgi:hypothetical protein